MFPYLLNDRMKIFGDISAEECRRLRVLQQQHLEAHMKAYGKVHLKPKHHFSLHLPSQYLRDSMVLDAFTVERKHKQAKAAIGPICNSNTFERDVMARLLAQQHRQLQDINCFYRAELVTVRGAAPARSTELALLLQASIVEVGEKLACHKGFVAVDDVLLIGNLCGRVLACLLVDALPFVLLRSFVPVDGKHGSAQLWKEHVDVFCFSLCECFEQVPLWSYRQDGVLLTLR